MAEKVDESRVQDAVLIAGIFLDAGGKVLVTVEAGGLFQD